MKSNIFINQHEKKMVCVYYEKYITSLVAYFRHLKRFELEPCSLENGLEVEALIIRLHVCLLLQCLVKFILSTATNGTKLSDHINSPANSTKISQMHTYLYMM